MNSKISSLSKVMVGLVMLAACTAAQAQTRHANSLMIDADSGGDIVIRNNEPWEFDRNCARTYFSGTPSQQNQQASQNKCTFFDGGTLTNNVTVEARTCWNRRGNWANGPIPVEVIATLAGETALDRKPTRKDDWSRRYSFELTNPAGKSRISNLTVTVLDEFSNQVAIATPRHSLEFGMPGVNACLLEFPYVGNAGSSGVNSLLLNGSMGSILVGPPDNFPGNNGGCPYTAIAHMDPVTFLLDEGEYNIFVSATLKGLDGAVDTPGTISIRKKITAGSCSQ